MEVAGMLLENKKLVSRYQILLLQSSVLLTDNHFTYFVTNYVELLLKCLHAHDLIKINLLKSSLKIALYFRRCMDKRVLYQHVRVCYHGCGV